MLNDELKAPGFQFIVQHSSFRVSYDSTTLMTAAASVTPRVST